MRYSGLAVRFRFGAKRRWARVRTATAGEGGVDAAVEQTRAERRNWGHRLGVGCMATTSTGARSSASGDGRAHREDPQGRGEDSTL
eukprot:3745255-Pyramimonas_sp.AAC.1